MRLSQLRAMLDEIPGDPEVRLAQQPSWPFEYSIGTVIVHDETSVVYITEGTQLGYLPDIGW